MLRVNHRIAVRVAGPILGRLGVTLRRADVRRILLGLAVALALLSLALVVGVVLLVRIV